MKFFNNKAITLIELITSVAISGVLFMIIFVFITDSVNELVDNKVRVGSVDESFELKDTMSKFIRGGYSDATVFTGITSASYTGTSNSGSLKPNQNSVLYLKKLDLTEGILLGIVNINTKNIQRNYVYGENFLAFRYLSVEEMSEIDLDSDKIYDVVFHDSDIFKNLRMQDFIVNLYNGGNLIEIYFKVINLFDASNFGNDFQDFFIDNLEIDEYNLIF